MRRITLAFVSTLAVLVLLFSYRTSTSGRLPSAGASSRAHILSGTVSTSAPPTSAARTVAVPKIPPVHPTPHGSPSASARASGMSTHQSAARSGPASTAAPTHPASATVPPPTVPPPTVPPPTVPPPTTAPATTAPATAAPATAAPTSAAPAPTAPAPTHRSVAPLVVDGDSVSTPYGDVQVEVTLSAGRITAVRALQYPQQSGRDQEINSQAIPQLESQVLSAQSARVDGVSGATYTTQGYLGSLQSALDAAHFR